MKIHLRIEKHKDYCQLSIKGDLTVQNAADFKEQLQQLHSEEGELRLSLKDAHAIDVSGVQLVRCFKQLVTSTHRELQIIPPDRADVIGLLAKTGLFSILQTETNLKFNTKQK